MPQLPSTAGSHWLQDLTLLTEGVADALDCEIELATAGTARSSTTVVNGRFDRIDAGRLLISLPVDESARLTATVKPVSKATVRFVIGRDEVRFDSPYLGIEQTSACAVVLALELPQALSLLPRRKSFRLPVTADDGVRLRVWRIDRYVLVRDKPLASSELKCDLLDVGPGGLRMQVYATRAEALGLVENQRLRIELELGKTSVLLEGKIRYPKATARDDAQAVCGVSFVFREQDIESRKGVQKLSMLLSLLERSIARRRQVA